MPLAAPVQIRDVLSADLSLETDKSMPAERALALPVAHLAQEVRIKYRADAPPVLVALTLGLLIGSFGTLHDY